ncbi:hypothetical protein LA66_00005 [Aureimonas altamirensis]|uniref:Uncharacterized protein n=1 Tax=Aureimonas altamirensis TaxID=370622 RepID=A0A0B1Q2N6_9HYPH|nr:hypothetical protein [Aureimonas altamirensis]KHJ55113.1 hypothetical protein LA66_00005 [Aureimonas altamirensis]
MLDPAENPLPDDPQQSRVYSRVMPAGSDRPVTEVVHELLERLFALEGVVGVVFWEVGRLNHAAIVCGVWRRRQQLLVAFVVT